PPAGTDAAPGYRALFRLPGFAGLWLSFALTVGASALAGLTLGTLVYERTGSPLLTAVGTHGATLATVLGALTLMSVADGRRPRRTLLVLQWCSVAGVAAQAVPGLPSAARLGLVLSLGFTHSLATGCRLGLLTGTVPPTGYARARSLMGLTAAGATALCQATGALLLSFLSPAGPLLIAAALLAAGAVVVATTVRERPPSPAPDARSARPGVRATLAVNRRLLSRPGRRALLLNLWVPNGLVAGCSALFVPHSPQHAGLLLAAGSLGTAAGDLLVGRLLAARARRRSAFALRLLLAAPWPLFLLDPPPAVLAAAVFSASLGYAASLPLQERLLVTTPEAERGQVQGVDAAGRPAWQGLGALFAGALAQVVGPAGAMTVVAGLSLAVTLASRPFAARAGV
ncbi:MFS transporter, partial [Streptomyces alkaliphilus]|uniref:MFS transporter n=1 Tax=Streptomyces alkaliphilus TaxID=1472722 RepID=UPI00117E81D7